MERVDERMLEGDMSEKEDEGVVTGVWLEESGCFDVLVEFGMLVLEQSPFCTRSADDFSCSGGKLTKRLGAGVLCLGPIFNSSQIS